MNVTWFEFLGRWNPQLMRELKGRLTGRNLAIAIGLSLLLQLILFLGLTAAPSSVSMTSKFCTLNEEVRPAYERQQAARKEDSSLNERLYQLKASPDFETSPALQQQTTDWQNRRTALRSELNHLHQDLYQSCPPARFDRQLWSQERFPAVWSWLATIQLFGAIGLGTFLLLSDLAQEERKGTLDFIRLSPQVAGRFFWGKLLGVPVLLYVGLVGMLPLQAILVRVGRLPSGESLSTAGSIGFYLVLMAACACFYSLALLWGLLAKRLPVSSSLHPWLCSGGLMLGLAIASESADRYGFLQGLGGWFYLFCPQAILPFVFSPSGMGSSIEPDYPHQWNRAFSAIPEHLFPHSVADITWAGFSLGPTLTIAVLVMVLHYALWTAWLGQMLSRGFHAPEATLLSKRQSYLLTACTIAIALGFVATTHVPREVYKELVDDRSAADLTLLRERLAQLLGAISLGFLILTAALLPHRQAIIDWARYRRERRRSRHNFWRSELWRDLVAGERSPAMVALGINLAIVFFPIVAWIAIWPYPLEVRLQAIAGTALSLTVLWIYGSLAQWILMGRSHRTALWAGLGVGSVSLLPVIALMVLGIDRGETGGGLYLFSMVPWYAVELASLGSILKAFTAQILILGTINWQMTRTLHRAGRSESHDLFQGVEGQSISSSARMR